MLQKNYHKFDFKYPKIGKKLCKKLIGWGGGGAKIVLKKLDYLI